MALAVNFLNDNVLTEDTWFHQDGASPYFRIDVRTAWMKIFQIDGYVENDEFLPMRLI